MNTLAEHIHSKKGLPSSFDRIKCRVARTREELEKAYNLVYKEYYKRAYTSEIPSRMRFSIHNALPETTTFVAVTDSSEIASTATIIPDSPLGLPMDKIYTNELNQLRNQGKKLCEISMLASDSRQLSREPLSSPLKRLLPLFMLFKAVLDYSLSMLKTDIMCITIHPKYKDAFNELAFRDLSGIKSYPDANGAPAIGMCVDMHALPRDFSLPGKEKLYEIFVLNTTDPARFIRKMTHTLQDLQYFFLEKSEIFKSAPPAQVEYVKSRYYPYSYLPKL